jgi:hypothetical protein
MLFQYNNDAKKLIMMTRSMAAVSDAGNWNIIIIQVSDGLILNSFKESTLPLSRGSIAYLNPV